VNVPAESGRERIALVLAGGGARGAYEFGALAALAPALTESGQVPDIVVGTSIGALNGAFVASHADEGFATVADHGVEMWRELGWRDALSSLASSALEPLLPALEALVGRSGDGAPGLLDPAPLQDTLARLIPFERLERNVAAGALTAAAVVTTAYDTTRSVVFHHGGPDLEPDLVQAIDYVSTPLRREHVLASASIPGVFPAVEIREPASIAGWYGDGGVRLNAPLAPALALGADRVVVVGLNSSVTSARMSARPDAIDGFAQMVQVALADQLASDVVTLATVNESLADRADPAGGRLRRVPYIFVAPQDRLEIGRLARDVYQRHYAGLKGLVHDRDLALLGRLVETERNAVHGELLSYLFLAREFVDELIALGRRDGERWLDARHDDGVWQIAPLRVPQAP